MPGDPAAGYGEDTPIYGSMNFVDLAGSERVKQTKAEGGTLAESNNINTCVCSLPPPPPPCPPAPLLQNLYWLPQTPPGVAPILGLISWHILEPVINSCLPADYPAPCVRCVQWAVCVAWLCAADDSCWL